VRVVLTSGKERFCESVADQPVVRMSVSVSWGVTGEWMGRGPGQFTE